MNYANTNTGCDLGAQAALQPFAALRGHAVRVRVLPGLRFGFARGGGFYLLEPVAMPLPELVNASDLSFIVLTA